MNKIEKKFIGFLFLSLIKIIEFVLFFVSPLRSLLLTHLLFSFKFSSLSIFWEVVAGIAKKTALHSVSVINLWARYRKLEQTFECSYVFLNIWRPQIQSHQKTFKRLNWHHRIICFIASIWFDSFFSSKKRDRFGRIWTRFSSTEAKKNKIILKQVYNLQIQNS